MVCIVLILSSMASAWCVLGVGISCENQVDSNEDVEIIKQSPYETIIKRGQVYEVTKYGYPKNVLDDGEWKDYTEVHSLMNKEGWNYEILPDGINNIKLIDFNATDYIIEMSSKNLNENIPIKVKGKKLSSIKFNSLEQKRYFKIKTPDVMTNNITLGSRSTTLKILADNSNTSDAVMIQSFPDTNFNDNSLLAGFNTNNINRIAIVNNNTGIPSNQRVFYAELNLTCFDACTVGYVYNIYRLRKQFTELNITWNAANTSDNWDTAGASGAGDRELVYSGETFRPLGNNKYGVLSINGSNFTKINQGMINGSLPSYGFLIRNNDESTPVTLPSFASKDNANVTNRPVFFYRYGTNDNPLRPTLNSPLNNSKFTNLPTLSWNNGTDPEGSTLAYYLEVDNDAEFGSPDYVNASINETENPTSDTTSGLLGGQVYYWRVLATDGIDNSSWSQTRFFNHNVSIINSTVEIETPIFSGKLTTIYFNVSYTNASNFIDDISATMQYNGSIFDMSENQIEGGLSRFSQDVIVPYEITSLPIFFNTTISYNNGSIGYEQTINFTQTIDEVVMGFCNDTLNALFLNFTFKDEENSSLLAAQIVDSTFNYSINSDFSSFRSFTYSNSTNNPSYAFCGKPNTTIFMKSDIDYKTAGYPQKTYINNSMPLNDTVTNIQLLLTSILDGQSVTFQVVNAAGQPLSGVAATVVRSGTLVESGFTDDAGSITFFLNPDFTYTFTFIKSGFNTFATTLKPTQSTFTVTMATTEIASENINQDIVYTISPTNDVLDNETFINFTFEINSGFFIIQEAGFTLINGSDASQLIGSATCSGSTGCTSSLNTTTGNFTSISMNYFWKVNNTFGNATRTWRVIKTSAFEGSFALFKKDINNLGDSFDEFTKAILTLFITLIVVGSLTWVSGQTAPLAILGEIFATVFFLDMLGIVPRVGGVGAIDNLVTVIIGAIFIIYALNESRRLL